MRVARCHPLLGWLRLDGHTYSRRLDQSLRERDRVLELHQALSEVDDDAPHCPDVDPLSNPQSRRRAVNVA